MTNITLNIETIINVITRILSIGYANSIATGEIERIICSSPYFISLENDDDYPIVYTDEIKIVASLFAKSVELHVPSYVECSWVAEMIVNIFLETSLTFEAIFQYFPLEKFYFSFALYHEMGSTHFNTYFLQIVRENNILSILLKKYRITSKELSEKTGIKLSTINALRANKRSISKLEFAKAVLISKIFRIRPETLLTYNSVELLKYRQMIKYSDYNDKRINIKDLIDLIDNHIIIYKSNGNLNILESFVPIINESVIKAYSNKSKIGDKKE